MIGVLALLVLFTSAHNLPVHQLAVADVLAAVWLRTLVGLVRPTGRYVVRVFDLFPSEVRALHARRDQ